MKQAKLLTCAVALAFLASIVRAEEGGSAHYAPGATADFLDVLPGKPGFIIADAYTYYDGSATPPIDFAGNTTLNVNARLNAETIFGLYETPLRLLGGNYATAITIPYVWLEVDGNVETGPLGLIRPHVHDETSGLGDITVYPFILGWTNGTDFKYDVRFGVYTPTGSYEKGQLANAGRNYWTFEPSASFSWLSTTIGTEVTLFTGFDFNTENEATEYQSGDSFHLDGTVAQHLPVFGGFAGVGQKDLFTNKSPRTAAVVRRLEISKAKPLVLALSSPMLTKSELWTLPAKSNGCRKWMCKTVSKVIISGLSLASCFDNDFLKN